MSRVGRMSSRPAWRADLGDKCTEPSNSPNEHNSQGRYALAESFVVTSELTPKGSSTTDCAAQELLV